MKKWKLLTTFLLVTILSCNTKTDETPPSPDGFGEASWFKNNDFYQATILEKQKENGRFPLEKPLEGYGKFDNYTSILARKIVFEEKKKKLQFENGWVFPNNLSDESCVTNLTNTVPKVYLRRGEFLFATKEPCLNKVIILHEEKTDIVTVYVCRIYNRKETVYKKIFEGTSFAISTWGWYKRVFGGKDNEMAVDK